MLCHRWRESSGYLRFRLIDAIAVGLEMGLLNKRGRILNEEHIFHLTEDIYLTQDDIRQVQLACDDTLLPLTEELMNQIEFLELASLPEFSRTFAKSMNFREETQ